MLRVGGFGWGGLGFDVNGPFALVLGPAETNVNLVPGFCALSSCRSRG